MFFLSAISVRFLPFALILFLVLLLGDNKKKKMVVVLLFLLCWLVLCSCLFLISFLYFFFLFFLLLLSLFIFALFLLLLLLFFLLFMFLLLWCYSSCWWWELFLWILLSLSNMSSSEQHKGWETQQDRINKIFFYVFITKKSQTKPLPRAAKEALFEFARCSIGSSNIFAAWIRWEVETAWRLSWRACAAWVECYGIKMHPPYQNCPTHQLSGPGSNLFVYIIVYMFCIIYIYVYIYIYIYDHIRHNMYFFIISTRIDKPQSAWEE